jgi:ElaB/YqjD/DUF883 family membrane-anchored ribosome-binding protein
MQGCILSQQDAGTNAMAFLTFCRHKSCSTLRLAQILFHDLKRSISDMPENGSINEPNTGATGTTGTTGATGTGAGTGTATALSQTAHDYGQKISEVASQAKDYVSDKVSVVGDKFKELQNADLGELAENAKEYARQKPGQALLISAAAGLLLGLIIRGRR